MEVSGNDLDGTRTFYESVISDLEARPKWDLKTLIGRSSTLQPQLNLNIFNVNVL